MKLLLIAIAINLTIVLKVTVAGSAYADGGPEDLLGQLGVEQPMTEVSLESSIPALQDTADPLNDAPQLVQEPALPVMNSPDTAVAAVDPTAPVDAIEPLAKPAIVLIAPLTEPTVAVLAPVVQPVAAEVAPVTGPVLEITDPVLPPIIEVIARVIEPVTDMVAPVTGPVLEITDPVLLPINKVIAPVIEPVTDLAEPLAPATVAILSPPMPGTGLGGAMFTVPGAGTPPATGGLETSGLAPVAPVSAPSLVLEPPIVVLSPLRSAAGEPTTTAAGIRHALVAGGEHVLNATPAGIEKPPVAPARSFVSAVASWSGSHELPSVPSGFLPAFAASLLALAFLARCLLVEASVKTWSYALLIPPR